MKTLFLYAQTMSKFVNLTIIIATLICYLPLHAKAQTTETIVKVDPSVISVTVNEGFVVNITVINVQNLYGVEAKVSWNTSLLQLVDVDIRLGVQSHPDGVLYEPIFNITEEDTGKFTIAATSYNPAPSFNGSGNIMRMTFHAIDIGESVIDLETKLYDYPPPDREPRESLPIPHTTIDGTVNAVIPEIPNTITLITLFIIVTIILVFLMKINRYFSRQKSNATDKINIQKFNISSVSEAL